MKRQGASKQSPTVAGIISDERGWTMQPGEWERRKEQERAVQAEANTRAVQRLAESRAAHEAAVAYFRTQRSGRFAGWDAVDWNDLHAEFTASRTPVASPRDPNAPPSAGRVISPPKR
jgi:hypothetical protein